MRRLQRFQKIDLARLMVALGANIKRARLDRTLTISELSDLSTVSGHLISRLESGHARNLEMWTLVKVSTALKSQPSELLRFKPKNPPRHQELEEADMRS